MKPLRKRIEAKLGSVAFRRFQRWVFKQNDGRAARLGERFGRLAYRLSKRYRYRTMTNLAIAFPELPYDDRKALALKVFEHFGRTAADFMRSGLRTDAEVLANTEVEGLENLEGALAQGKGVLLITAHFGNWERAGHWVTAMGHKMSVVARDANDSDLNDLVNNLRKNSGIKVIARGNAVKPIFQALRRGEVVAILPDQNSGESFVPFFGKPAGTVQGPAVLHLRSGAPIVPAYCLVTGPGKLRLLIRPVIEAAPNCEDPVRCIMTAINQSLEDVVRQYPDQYLWLHDRWKSARRRGLL